MEDNTEITLIQLRDTWDEVSWSRSLGLKSEQWTKKLLSQKIINNYDSKTGTF